MMKKILILTLVLSMASLAPAALQISVNGDPDPVDSEINIAPSDHLVLDVHTDIPLDCTGTYYLMVVDAAQGSLSGCSPLQGNASIVVDDWWVPYFMYYAGLDPAGLSGVAGVVAGSDESFVFEGKIVDLIDFHCEGPEDAVVQLYSSPYSVTWTLVDQVIIHQVPEPVTMALLGLGGLLISCRRVGSK